MKEKLLLKLKKKYLEEKNYIENYNYYMKKINTQDDEIVESYLTIMGLTKKDIVPIDLDDKEIILEIILKNLYKIKEEDTNNIFVYIGTYKFSNKIFKNHISKDIEVDYNDPSADYRIYWNIESKSPIMIHISRCSIFENAYTVFDSKNITFNDIQKDFFYKAITENQEEAKKYILTKYKRLNK